MKDIDPEKVKEREENVYDRETKSMDMRNLKATDLKNNKMVILPKLEEDDNEIRRNHVSNEPKEVFINYRKKNCDKHGNILKNNLNKNQLE